jgi:polyisoprenoid-binding protein YceI
MRLCLNCCFIPLLFFSVTSFCQTIITKTGFIGFYSTTPFEDIRAENNQAFAVLDLSSHRIAFAVLLKGFLFPKELMQEHFNENYAETDKYPKATFSGICSGEMELFKEGIYQVIVKGDLNLHGVTQPLETTALLEVKNDRILATANFKVKPENFKISIPGVVRDKIAREINVKIQTTWMRKN